METFDTKSLARYNGEDGRRAYIVYKDRVLDVSDSRLWKTGTHMKRHRAGCDLTADLQAAPHDTHVLDRFPQVGVFEKEADSDIRVPVRLEGLLTRFPMLRRHPHPMTVHFPIVFMIAAAVFSVLYLATGVASFETTHFHCLGGGVIFSLVAILTGLYTWWINYHARPVRAVNIKLRISPLMFALSLAAFIWRCVSPDVLAHLEGAGYLYLTIILALFPLVSVIGWFGAQLTFPTEKG